jgi:hypothetical protein
MTSFLSHRTEETNRRNFLRDKRRMIVITGFIFLVTLTVVVVRYLSSANFISGVVRSSLTGVSISSARIETDYHIYTFSLPDGSYIISHPPGDFTITAVKSGYEAESYSVHISQFGPTTRNFSLTPQDSDGDGILDIVEYASGCLKANDADSDGDGIQDGVEDANHDGILDPGETNPCRSFKAGAVPWLLLLLFSH